MGKTKRQFADALNVAKIQEKPSAGSTFRGGQGIGG